MNCLKCYKCASSNLNSDLNCGVEQKNKFLLKTCSKDKSTCVHVNYKGKKKDNYFNKFRINVLISIIKVLIQKLVQTFSILLENARVQIQPDVQWKRKKIWIHLFVFVKVNFVKKINNQI